MTTVTFVSFRVRRIWFVWNAGKCYGMCLPFLTFTDSVIRTTNGARRLLLHQEIVTFILLQALSYAAFIIFRRIFIYCS